MSGCRVCVLHCMSVQSVGCLWDVWRHIVRVFLSRMRLSVCWSRFLGWLVACKESRWSTEPLLTRFVRMRVGDGGLGASPGKCFIVCMVVDIDFVWV